GRGAILADDAVCPFVKADRAADFTGIEYRGDFSIRFLVEPEADFLAILLRLIAVQIAIIKLLQRDADLSVHKSEFGGWRQSAHALGVNEFRRNHEDKNEGTGIDRSHPQALTACAPLRFAVFSRRCWKGGGLASLVLKQDHQRGQGDNSDEEKQVIADDRTDQGHFFFGRSDHAALGKLMQAADDQLCGDKKQDNGRHAEKLLQIDAYAALNEHHAEENGNAYPQQRSQETEQFGCI